MENETECKNCNQEIVIIENGLFYSEEKIDTNVFCPECDDKILTLKTDGWFFVQTKTEYIKEIEIEKSKQRLVQFNP